jgi:hypothetical protein
MQEERGSRLLFAEDDEMPLIGKQGLHTVVTQW